MNLILTKDDISNQQQLLHQLKDENYISSSSSVVALPNLQSSDQQQQGQMSYMINNKINEFISSMLSQQQHHQQQHQLDSNTIGNSFVYQEETISNTNNTNNCTLKDQQQYRELPYTLPTSISHNQIRHEETLRKDPEEEIFTQKKQNNSNCYYSTGSMQQQEENKNNCFLDNLMNRDDYCQHCVKTNLTPMEDEKCCNLILSFTENEMEMIEQRFMNGLYLKFVKEHIKQESFNGQLQQQQVIYNQSVSPSQIDEHSVGNSIRNQAQCAFDMMPSQVSNNFSAQSASMNQQTTQVNHWNNSSNNLSQESSALVSLHTNLPKQARLPKRKKKLLMTTTLDSTPMINNNSNNNYSKLCPPSINIKQTKTSKKRDRNNSVSDSPTKKTVTTTAASTNSIYRGHVSNSNSFSKESPWQFHTYSEGKRNQSENLVFFHFNPKRN